jgi:hypothetical protein
MTNMRAHELHQIMRSWLLAEDPYGMNQRQEPTFGTPAPAGAAPAPGRSPVAQAAGESAVANATAPDPRGETAGPQAVERQLFGGQGARYSEAERDPRAQAQGEQAVGRATAPSPTAEVDRTRGQAWGENAVDKALNPPTGSGGGFWMPGEAADTASAVGEQAVGGELAKKARSKMARGRLKDPVDPDDRQPD